MAHIAFLHNQLGKTDGISLEVEKWRSVLENRFGHKVSYCAGNDDYPKIYCIEEFSFSHPETHRIIKNATYRLNDYSEEHELLDAIYKMAERLKVKLKQFLHERKIDLLIPNNLQSVGYHVPATIALYEVIKETGLPTICHSHDFYFEPSGEVHPTCPGVLSILEQYAPPDLPNVKHVVINKIAREELWKRRNIKSSVIPNVWNFNNPPWRRDEYNQDFRETFGIEKNALLFLQATRIMNRKGIELAIDVVAHLNWPENKEKLVGPLYDGRLFTMDDPIILFCAGYLEHYGISDTYYQSLVKKADDLHVDLRFAPDSIGHCRTESEQGKVYALWDSYVEADCITYPSLWEGWGNQFIEAVFAKKPVMIFEYPVWISDLKDAGFHVFSLGSKVEGGLEKGFASVSQTVIEKVVEEIIACLKNETLYREITEHNYKIAQEKYSYDHLEKALSEVLVF